MDAVVAMRASRTAAGAKCSSSVPAGKSFCAQARRSSRWKMLEPLDRDVQDREPLENVPHRRSYPADWRRLRRHKTVQRLRDQLKKAQEEQDKPAVIELSRRIVEIAQKDSETWDTLAQTQFESEELDGLERTLDAWQKAFQRAPAAIEDFRAGLCFKRKDYQCAEQHWLAFIATKPPRADA